VIARSLYITFVIACATVGCLAARTGTSIPTVVRVWGPDVQPPVLVQRVEPIFPTLSPRARVGSIVLELWIDEKGTVADVKVLVPRFKDLTDAAVAAAKKWKFSPATVHGNPIPTIIDVTVPVRPASANREPRPN
jgi:TonB family protein